MTGAAQMLAVRVPLAVRKLRGGRKLVLTPGGKLRLPDNISLLLLLLPLPPYSPELNPVENLWQFLRQNHLSNRVCETCEAIVDACCDAWNALVAEPERITTIASRDWAEVRA